MSINHFRGRLIFRHVLVVFSLLVCSSSRSLSGDDARLTERQSELASRFQQLEELLLRLAEVEAAENPERSALLRRAARQSSDKFVLDKMRSASESLKTQEFQKAVDSQTSARQELAALLTLLMSEDRSKRIRDEKDRLSNIAKAIKRALRAQQSTRARTENGAELDEVQPEQESIGDRAEALANELAEEYENSSPEDSSPTEEPSEKAQSSESEPSDDQQNSQDEADPKSGDEKSDEQQAKAQEAGEQKAGEQGSKTEKPAESESQKSESNPKDAKQSESPQEGSQSQQSESQQSESQQPSQPQTPEQQVEQELRQAIERMRDAQEQLGEGDREQATEQQRAAEDKLRAAIERLERILRQLREEEMQRELARLEARLRKMAAMQSKVLDDTVALAATPIVQRNRQTDLKAGDLAFEQKKITLESDRAMLLLREEGSSVAFPEVISQISSDSTRVADFLSETKIDVVTQGIQTDILAALEEMIAATQQAQRDLEQKKQQQQGKPQQGGQQEEPLVEALAELRLIRTMETRIKSTTERYSGLLESGDQPTSDILPLLRDLSERQNRLYRITRDLVLKRNK
jgi:hypothetical protein